jgi:decaprenylphospho-beta-D-erythro-pentofuranosid-2-ulose 2-reductase
VAFWERAVIVGASSGIGEAIALQLGAEGTEVVLVARRTEALEVLATRIETLFAGRASVVTCDVRDVAAGQAAFASIVAEGAVDLIVYSSGIMPQGTHGAFPTDVDVASIETNVIGAVTWLNAAATYFSERGSGTIVGISSVAGERGRRANPVYNATKAALSTYLESLRYRLNPHGIKVVCIKPGPVQTPMMGDRKVRIAPTADSCARQVIRAAKKGRRVVYIPRLMRVVSLVLHVIPPPIMERLPF